MSHGWLEGERQALASAVELRRGAQERFEETLARVTSHMLRLANAVESREAELERQVRPPVDVDTCLGTLSLHGPQALTVRESRALLCCPDRVPASWAQRILQHRPGLLRHLLRTVLGSWYRYCEEPWGEDYFGLLCYQAAGSGIPILENARVGVAAALGRRAGDGPARLAGALSQTSLGEVHQHLKRVLGLRDAWVYTGQVLACWLGAEVERGRAIDGALESLRADPRLRAVLLPSPSDSDNAVAGVRGDGEVRARCVATLLRASFGQAPLLSRKGLSQVIGDVMRSPYGDPRLPPLGEDWRRVRELAERPFRALLASLSEQDLEVFFAHAMNEPDRRKFWLAYLPAIERTGCVLGEALREQLRTKLRGVPELQGAIERAHRFRRGSSVQAFYLVFATVVVVEFSETGNAAYVYERQYFEDKLERRIRACLCDGIGELKLQFHNVYRLLHQAGWQGTASQWLSERGIHAGR